MAARKPSIKNQAKQTKRTSVARAKTEQVDSDELSPSQLRELDRRIKDLDDRKRYILVSTLGPNFVLFYNVSEDTYGYHEPGHATLFKRKKAAQAIQHLLGDNAGIIECAVNKRGQLVKKSIKMGRK
jgi:hypothetical protein